MLSKLRRLYRGLCWLMDTDCGMPWDMADLGEIRGRVAVLEEQHRANAGTWCRLFDLETNVGDHKQAVHKRLAYLEDWLRSLDVRVDAQEAEAQPQDRDHDGNRPVICSPVESLQKMSLAAVTEEHFDAIGAYVMEALLVQDFGLESATPKVISEALQAYAKGDR